MKLLAAAFQLTVTKTSGGFVMSRNDHLAIEYTTFHVGKLAYYFLEFEFYLRIIERIY